MRRAFAEVALGVLASLGSACGAAHSEVHPRTPAAASDTGPIGTCAGAGVALQVLGSGGPIVDDGRASSAYLVWIDGHARALIDAGSGLLPRFGEAGARLEDLEVIALSHLHVDHAGGLPGLLKAGYFVDRKEGLPILGPSGSDRFPDTKAFLEALLSPERGAFAYLSDYITGEGLFPVKPVVIDLVEAAGPAVEPGEAGGTLPQRAFDGQQLSIAACPVKHGDVPALGYRVTVGSTRVAFAGDQTAAEGGCFDRLAAGANLLVAHHAIPQSAEGNVRNLHARPSELGALAARTEAKVLLLAHNMQRAMRELDVGRVAIAKHYSGPVMVAEDLDCVQLEP